MILLIYSLFILLKNICLERCHQRVTTELIFTLEVNIDSNYYKNYLRNESKEFFS